MFPLADLTRLKTESSPLASDATLLMDMDACLHGFARALGRSDRKEAYDHYSHMKLWFNDLERLIDHFAPEEEGGDDVNVVEYSRD